MAENLKFPCMNVKMVPIEKVEANNYNPNHVSENNMKLLHTSIADNGVCYAIITVYDENKDKYIIVDGFHRYTDLKDNWNVKECPVIVLPHDLKHRMSATVQFNRARGIHKTELMGDLVQSLVMQGMSDCDIAKNLGMELEEVFRLKQITGIAELFKNAPYSRSWEVQKKSVRELRFIMRTVPEWDTSEYKKIIPNLELCVDYRKNAYLNFCAALELAGNDPCIHLEDDIILCDYFITLAKSEILKRPNEVIQFFSMRKKDDVLIGSRYIAGSRFISNLCFYLPEGLGLEILEFSKTWIGLQEHPTGYDLMMADYLKSKKLKYWNVVPNLVDHKHCVSRINPHRSTYRKSFTFKKEILKELTK